MNIQIEIIRNKEDNNFYYIAKLDDVKIVIQLSIFNGWNIYSKEYRIIIDNFISKLYSLKFTILNYKSLLQHSPVKSLMDKRISIPSPYIQLITNYYGYNSLEEFYKGKYNK